ncbi:MAG: GNAT family N-acetyltransferase [bacterium]|nr:GNAT family N-acetyltransferase [bacterium]
MNHKIILRKFEETDVSDKVKWINDSEINQYLHYELPLCEVKTKAWYHRTKEDKKRADYMIDVMEENTPVPVGLIGLLEIDNKNRKAEFYITLGNRAYWGKGIAAKASTQFIDTCFRQYDLNKIYLYTETGNEAAQRLFEKVGFKKEGLLREDLIQDKKNIDRYYYGLLKSEFFAHPRQKEKKSE